ncbi:MAG: helix-turn-helix domain-containing protein [Methylobacteriaceae bacterium]|nr:helix-turn-helix domain-containing protein [Methylobacteriaceae bacterium]
MARGATDIDRAVGVRMRMRRTEVGMSQERLGADIGVTFQQVQKYEKGRDRVSASRLQQIARALGVSVSYFYEGEDGQRDASEGPRIGWTAQSLALVRAFERIEDAEIRRRVVKLVESLAPAK